MRRIFMIFTAMLIPLGGLSLALSGTAGASTGKITCTTVTGTVNGTITISGCTGGNTGGSSQPQNTLSLETGGTTHWVSGSTTTTGAPTTTVIPAKACPGYVKPPKGQTPPEPAALSVVGSITADTGDGMLLPPGTQTGSVCVGLDGNTITALKPFVFSWTRGSSIACTTMSGNVSGNLTVGGCTGGNTGGSSQPFSGISLAAGGSIPWVSGASVTFSTPTLTSVSASHCPGYVKGAATEPAAESFSATVTADTNDGLKLPGAAKGAICIASDGTVSLLKTLSAK